MKIVCEDGRAFDVPVAADLFGLVANLVADLGSARSDLGSARSDLEIPFGAARFERFYSGLLGLVPFVADKILADYMQLRVNTVDLQIWGRCYTYGATSIKLLAFVNEQAPYKTWDASGAASAGRIDCIEFIIAHADHNVLTSECTRAAASAGQLETLMWLRERDCPWLPSSTCTAASNGHLDCLKYCCENGCGVDSDCVVCASVRGQLECLRYLHERGCELTGECMRRTMLSDHLECFKFLIEHGCPICTGVPFTRPTKCTRYAEEIGLMITLGRGRIVRNIAGL